MEYKLSSFQFSAEMSREDKHHVIKMINSIRSRCPSDANFTGAFRFEKDNFHGEIKVLFSKGTFFVTSTESGVPQLIKALLNSLQDQIACWKSLRFDQPETFIDYSEYLNRERPTGS